MIFCPKCGTDIGSANFCPNCGASQGSSTHPQPPQPQVIRHTTGRKYDDAICLILCCCLGPVAAVIYYLLTDHEPETYIPPKIRCM